MFSLCLVLAAALSTRAAAADPKGPDAFTVTFFTDVKVSACCFHSVPGQ